MSLTELFFLVSIILFIVFTTYRRAYRFWEYRGVPHAKPEHPFFGSSYDVIFSRQSATDLMASIYDAFPRDRFVGLYHMTRPRLLIRDPNLVATVTAHDFAHFRNRYLHVNTRLDPLSGHLLNLRDEEWKAIRQKLTPVFSSCKLKLMHEQVLECADNLVNQLSTIEDNTAVNLIDLVQKFVTDALSSSAFGIVAGSLNDSEAKIHGIVKLIFEPSRLRVFRRFLRSEFGWFFNLIHWKNVPASLEKQFISIIDSTLEYREKHKICRVDFLQLSNELVKKDSSLSNSDPTAFTRNSLYANAFVFLIAGFETVASTICFTLYELALNNQIQEKAFQEVERISGKYSGLITAEAIKEMTFLSQVMSESLRKYPPIPLTSREVTSSYQIPGTSVVLPAGTELIISMHSIQRDPEHFEDPLSFKPERFNHAIKPGTYLPFGEGPRRCIGERFAKLQIKLALSKILLNFKVVPCNKTEVPLTMDERSSFFAKPKGGIWIGLENRTKENK